MILDKNKTGLVFGLFLATIHLIWSLGVLLIKTPMQSFLNWIFKLHALQPYGILTSFNFMNLILLLIMTFIIGYILGWIFAIVANYIHKK